MAKEKNEVQTNEEKKVKKENNKYRHEVEIKIEGEKWTTALDKIFTKKQKSVHVDGFRKGKVPKDIYLKKFGIESLYLDASDLVVQDAYTKALDDSKLDPIIQPNVDIKDINEEGVTFIFTIITKPDVKIINYKGLTIKKEEVKVEKEEVDHEIEHLLEEYTEIVTKDGKLENSNIAVIDYEGFRDGEAFDGGKGENYSLEIGSNTFIPGFEEKLIGMKAGEEKDIELTFPEEYHAKDLAGKDVVFHVKVNEVKAKIKRELDKEFFEDLGIDGVTDEDSLYKKVEEDIKSHKDREAENKYIDNLLEAVSKNVEVDIPEEIVEDEIQVSLKRVERNMMQQGLSMDIYFKLTNSTEEDLKNQLEPEAYKNVLYRFMLEELMNIENVKVTEDDANKEIDKIATDYHITREEVLKEIGSVHAMQYELEVRAVIDKLKEYNK